MPVANGCNHVTIVTHDLDRFIDFYTDVFEADVRGDLDEGPLRHALIDIGGGFCLHPFQVSWENGHEAGLPDMFSRGHLDHFAINMPDAASFELVRGRLVSCGASEGRIRDFGMVQVTSFQDPDGMECEIALWRDGDLLTMEKSRVEAYTH